LNDAIFGFLDGVAEALDDLPDGAWMAALEDAVREFDRMHKQRHDPHATVMRWVIVRNEEEEGGAG
jgi:hypothetical protein